MNRKKIAAANWKMNTTVEEGKQLLKQLLDHSLDETVDVVVCAPFTHLFELRSSLKGKNIFLGAQNISQHEHGAYTGEVSATMLKSCRVSHVIIGHSERREYFNEDNALLGLKLKQVLKHHLTPILCCGERLDIRKAGDHISHVLGQLKETLDGMSAESLSSLILAYEPIWAIGTGETASPAQAQEMHHEIRSFLGRRFDKSFASTVPILYGGSVKPGNANELFGQNDVDGGLVGGASLNAENFAAIVNAF